MTRPARNNPKPEPVRDVTVINEKPLDERLVRSKEAGNPNIPIRTILYVEVGDMLSKDVQRLCFGIMSKYAENEHPHYVLPIRHGKLASDIVFEEEWLRTIRQLCVVNDKGEIELRAGASEVEVIRKRV